MGLQDDAERIARGHEWVKHRTDFPGLSQADFEAMIKRIMADATEAKKLTAGRTAFWDESTNTVVIYDPSSPDLGTAFRPRRGKSYFDFLR